MARLSKQNEATLNAVKRQAAATAAAGEASVVGLGVDIVEIERMEQVIKRTPRFLDRVFSVREREYAWSKARPGIHYALFFAAKEAVLKALGTGFTGMEYTDVEVDHSPSGQPVPLLHGHAKEISDAQGVIEIQLSLSHTHTMGVASAVTIKEADRPKKVELPDPHQDLARQFKEMRSLLDDMDSRLSELTVAAPEPDSGSSLDAAPDPQSLEPTLGENSQIFQPDSAPEASSFDLDSSLNVDSAVNPDPSSSPDPSQNSDSDPAKEE